MNSTASIGIRTRKRLADRNKLPRSLWYPADNPAPDEETWEVHFPEVSATIRRTSVTVLAYSFFCFLTLGQSFKDIFEAGGITIPFGGTTITARAFLTVGPLVLLGLMAYLHIYVGRWETLRRGRDPDTLTPPHIFNLANPLAAFLSWLNFYLLAPVILFWFAAKAMAAPNGWIIDSIAIFGTVMLFFLALRRSRGWKRFLMWLALATVVGFGIAWDQTVTASDLRGFYRVNLRGAELEAADFSGFNLAYGSFQSANLQRTDMRNADLTSALLNGADLRGADFDSTDLTLAILVQADLRGAVNLYCRQLTTAVFKFAYRDPKLACGEPIPEPPLAAGQQSGIPAN